MEHIAMPQLGETVTEGTIISWLKGVGERVEVDDALFEVSTEKVDTEVPSAHAGYLREVLVAEGATVPVGTLVAVITATADEPYSAAPPPAPPAAPVPMPAATADATTAHSTPLRSPAPQSARLAAGVLSPVVRALLVEHGLAADDVRGSGHDGRITRADVLAAASNRSGPAGSSNGQRAGAGAGGPQVQLVAAPGEVGPDDEVIAFSKARHNTAVHMMRSLATSAHALVAVEVDYRAVDEVRRAAGLSFLPFVARAVVAAIGAFPYVNASVGDDELIVHRRVHLGIAVDVDNQALVVPVVHDADGLRLRALGAAIADVADRARRKRIEGRDLSGGTFTITNVGSYGTLVTVPVINQPQVAILSTDGVKMRPVAVALADGGWGTAIHPVGNLCLSFDHRAFDGAYAAAFLAQVRDRLETDDWAIEVAT